MRRQKEEVSAGEAELLAPQPLPKQATVVPTTLGPSPGLAATPPPREPALWPAPPKPQQHVLVQPQQYTQAALLQQQQQLALRPPQNPHSQQMAFVPIGYRTPPLSNDSDSDSEGFPSSSSSTSTVTPAERPRHYDFGHLPPVPPMTPPSRLTPHRPVRTESPATILDRLERADALACACASPVRSAPAAFRLSTPRRSTPRRASAAATPSSAGKRVLTPHRASPAATTTAAAANKTFTPTSKMVAAAKAAAAATTPSDRPVLFGETEAEGDEGCYYTVPGPGELAAMDSAALAHVEGFIVGHSVHGYVRFAEPVDLRGVDLPRTVAFERGAVEIYRGADDAHKPPRGAGLNHPAAVHLFGLYPAPGETHEALVARLRGLSDAAGATFEAYHAATGEWVQSVAHFSRYGLPSADTPDNATQEGDTQSSSSSSSTATAATQDCDPFAIGGTSTVAPSGNGGISDSDSDDDPFGVFDCSQSQTQGFSLTQTQSQPRSTALPIAPTPSGSESSQGSQRANTVLIPASRRASGLTAASSASSTQAAPAAPETAPDEANVPTTTMTMTTPGGTKRGAPAGETHSQPLKTPRTEETAPQFYSQPVPTETAFFDENAPMDDQPRRNWGRFDDFDGDGDGYDDDDDEEEDEDVEIEIETPLDGRGQGHPPRRRFMMSMSTLGADDLAAAYSFGPSVLPPSSDDYLDDDDDAEHQEQQGQHKEEEHDPMEGDNWAEQRQASFAPFSIADTSSIFGKNAMSFLRAVDQEGLSQQKKTDATSETQPAAATTESQQAPEKEIRACHVSDSCVHSQGRAGGACVDESRGFRCGWAPGGLVALRALNGNSNSGVRVAHVASMAFGSVEQEVLDTFRACSRCRVRAEPATVCWELQNPEGVVRKLRALHTGRARALWALVGTVLLGATQPEAEMRRRLGAWLGDARVAGVLLLTGTETFGVARTADGCVALFDSHGDAAQARPAVAYVWRHNLLGPAAPTVADGVRGVVDFVRSRAGTELELIGNTLDVCVLGFDP